MSKKLGNPRRAIERRGKELWPPPPVLTISEWADRYRFLSKKSSSEPGRWRTSRVPYLREIMDALGENPVVVFMASAQVGKTEAGLNAIGFYMDQDPRPILLVEPTIDMAEALSKDRIAPMLSESPKLAGLVKDRRARDSNNTILHKEFVGGQLTLSGANSETSLRSRAIGFLVLDEVSAYPASAGAGGDPVNLAMKRTDTFWNARIFKVSTPTIKGTCRIEQDFERSDKRYYFVPCPHCNHEQVLVWERMKWEHDKRTDSIEAWYECESCEGRITDAHKSEFLARGRWIASEPERSIPGFHLSAIYSPFCRFEKMVRAYLDAKDKPEQEKTFYNNWLGLPYEEQAGESLTWRTLQARSEPYPVFSVPRGALLLTAGVDVQKNRLAVSIWGWGKGEEAWAIYHCELFGNPADIDDKCWKDLDALLDSNYSHDSGELQISLAAIDTGFENQVVYNFCRTRPRCYAVRGSSALWKPIVSRPSLQEVSYRGKALKGGIQLWSIGTDTAKSAIYARMKLTQPGPGYFHFPQGLEDEFFEQLCSEKCVTTFDKGNLRRKWVKLRRNEALDCLVYAYAAAILAGLQRINWKRLELSLFPPPPAEPEPEAESRKPEAKKITRPSPVRRARRNFAKDW